MNKKDTHLNECVSFFNGREACKIKMSNKSNLQSISASSACHLKSLTQLHVEECNKV